VVGIVDTDFDELPEGLDNCPDAFNVNQSDIDGDGVGDVCDLETCGNGVVEMGETCDDGNGLDGDGCSSICAVEPSAVAIDVMPFSSTNTIKPRPSFPILVSILGSPTVDISMIDVTTISFGPDGATPRPRLTHPFIYWLASQDINGDGYADLTPAFRYGDTGLPVGVSQACLSGEMAGAPFMACDTVNVELDPSCGLGPELVPALGLLLAVRRRRARI